MKRSSFLSTLLSLLVLISASLCFELRMFSGQCNQLYFPSYNLLYQRPLITKKSLCRFCANSESFKDSEIDSNFATANNNVYTNFENTLKICELNKLKLKTSSSEPFLNAKPVVTKFRFFLSEITSKIYSTLPYLSSGARSFLQGLRDNWLIIGEIIVIAFAKYNPSFGASGGPLRPEFFIAQCGVFFIFFVNGVALQISGGGSAAEMQTAMKTNISIQLFNFGFIPLLACLLAPFYPDAMFRDGLLVLSVLPTTLNICVAQTLAAGGDMGTAIFNAIFANVVGVFLTPLLAILLLGAGKGVSLFSTLAKMGKVVILPLVLGQVVRKSPLAEFFQRISKYSRTMSSCMLLAIVYNVFSDTFAQGVGADIGADALGRLMVSMPLTYLGLSLLYWKITSKIQPGIDAPIRAAALLASSQKTLAFGIPFIKMAFGSRPDIAYILAPLLVFAPSQLLLGSAFLVPALRNWIRKSDSFEEGKGI